MQAEFITNITANSIEEAKRAAKAMLELGPTCAIVTLGGQGMSILSSAS